MSVNSQYRMPSIEFPVQLSAADAKCYKRQEFKWALWVTGISGEFCYLFTSTHVEHQLPYWVNPMDLIFYLNSISIKDRTHPITPRSASCCIVPVLPLFSAKQTFPLKNILLFISSLTRKYSHPSPLPNWAIKIINEKTESSTWTFKML